MGKVLLTVTVLTTVFAGVGLEAVPMNGGTPHFSAISFERVDGAMPASLTGLAWLAEAKGAR